MALSFKDAFQEAILKAPQEKKEQAEKRYTKLFGPDYLEEGISFLRHVATIEVVYLIPQYDWYGHLTDGVPKSMLREIEHFHAGGHVMIRKRDVDQLIAWKVSQSMLTQILDEHRTRDQNVFVANILAIYKL